MHHGVFDAVLQVILSNVRKSCMETAPSSTQKQLSKKGLRQGHVIKNIREGQLWFDHPKLCQVPAKFISTQKPKNPMRCVTLLSCHNFGQKQSSKVSPGGVAVLGSKGGTKGIDLIGNNDLPGQLSGLESCD